MKAIAGNSGPKVRSDCEITIELKERGGISLELNSKVSTLYGKSIIKQCNDMLAFFKIKNAFVKVDDSGALPFVISARMEAAIKQLIESEKEYLPVMLKENIYSTERDRFRFSRLYLPGNTPGIMLNAGLHSPDGIILDLEDSVAPEKKGEARFLIRNALRQVNFYGAERMVRINQGETGLLDLDYLIPHNVNLVLIPKCENPDYVSIVDRRIDEIKKKNNSISPVYLMPVIESALGVERAFEIAKSSNNIVALAIGLEDLTADLGVQRTQTGNESFYARTRIINAAKALKIQPIDSVFSDVSDIEGLKISIKNSRTLGFEGMGCIHPRQIALVKEGFTPAFDEIENAKRIISAFHEAKQKGIGVVTIGSKMIDQPVVIRAERTILLAVKLGLLSEHWNDKFEFNDNSTKQT